MSKEMSSEMKKYKEEVDFIHKKIGNQSGKEQRFLMEEKELLNENLI